MKIGIDARLWNQSGIGRYIRNICLNLLKIDEKNNYVLFVWPEDESDIKNQISKFKIKNLKLKIVSVGIKWHSLSEQIRLPAILNKENLDLMHFTYQQSVPIFYKKPYVLTIHDLIKHHYITGRSLKDPYWLLGFKMLFYKILINAAAKNARKIITVSQSTRNEIFDHLTVNKKNVEVIYEAADDFEKANSGKSESGRYFLFVGNVYAHKNAEKLIDAFKKLVGKKDVKLVFIGRKDYFYEQLMKNVSKLMQQGKIVFEDNADDEKLAGYYSNAVCLIRPSLMEGFSLPPLEAMTVGCLVLCSDIPVHRELFGNSVIYFNPNDAVDIEVKMDYVLSLDGEARGVKIKEGKEIVKKFSWEKTAKETLRIYESSTTTRSV